MNNCGITGCFDDAVMMKEKCYFCGNNRTIGFKEHYIFCPNCSAIYTFMIVQRKTCDHISDETPLKPFLISLIMNINKIYHEVCIRPKGNP